MKDNLLKRVFSIQEGETGRVGLLLIMSFFMGAFLATFSVGAQTQFLGLQDGAQRLPEAFVLAGIFGLFATLTYNFLQTRIPFRILAILSLLTITLITAFIEFGHTYVDLDERSLKFFAYAQIAPFTLVILLVFWGTFNRLFNVKQSKRLLGSVDQGALLASLISFFSIPIVLQIKGFDAVDLFTISLVAIVIFTLLFAVLSNRFADVSWSLKKERELNQKLTIGAFFRNKYVLYLSLFIIASIVALTFVDYSFLNASVQFFDPKVKGPDALPSFLSYFEATVVIFSFLFQTFAADKVIADYGLKTSVLVNPILIGIFTVVALVIGLSFGYTIESSSFIIFFIMIAMSKLFVLSVKESLDEPSFKLYLLPIETHIKLDVQTKLEGVVTGLAMLIAGGLILMIQRFNLVDLIYMTIFAIPLILGWYFVASKLYAIYRETLQTTLVKNKAKVEHKIDREYTVDKVLEKEVNSSAEDKVIYGLKLMEKLEPTLFENAVIRLAESEYAKVRSFAIEKIHELGIDKETIKNPEIRNLAKSAQGEAEDSDLLSIAPDKLMKLSKSVKPADRILAAKLLRKLISQRTIFILLELLRDVSVQVRHEALITARKVKRPETWSVLIELLSSPSYGHDAAAALMEAGPAALPVLETSFHKSGQTDLVMLRIVQIMGRIGGDEALALLWKKADYPDKRIVKQILYSLRYINYRASGRQAQEVTDLLETELGKTIWNLAALNELPDEPEYALLRDAIREEIRSNFDHVTMLLSILYDPEAVQLVRENIESGDPNGIAYALELMDLFVEKDLKPKLFPLFDDIPVEQKLEQLQVYFPRESYNPIQVINYILNRDFNMNNRWTKVCAVHVSAYLKDFRVSRGLIAQMFNQDKMLQETAAWVIYNKDKNIYKVISERLPNRDKKFLDSSIENNQLLDGLDDGFFLGIEMVLFLKQLPEFKNINGVLLADLFDKISPLDLNAGQKLTFDAKDHDMPIIIVALGEIKLKDDDTVVKTLKAGSVYGDIFQNGQAVAAKSIEATERSIVFKINLADFYFVMANHHELVEGLIKNITNTQAKANVLNP
jgi:AAA family ATP:ADP antiporter